MAASVSLNSTTMEGQLMELLTLMQVKETAGNVLVPNTNNITSSVNDDNGVFTANVTLPIAKSVSPTGIIETVAEEYLS